MADEAAAVPPLDEFWTLTGLIAGFVDFAAGRRLVPVLFAVNLGAFIIERVLELRLGGFEGGGL